MMSEHLFRFRLAELVTVRVVCQKCQRVAEVPIGKAACAADQGHICRFCGREFVGTKHLDDEHALAQFARAVEVLKDMGKTVEIEFLLPVEPAGDG